MDKYDEIKRDDNKGFSLIELIVSVAILALIISPILSSFLVSFEQNKKARLIERETNIVQAVAEDLKQKTPSEIEATYGKANIAGEGIITYNKQISTVSKDYYIVIDLENSVTYKNYNDFPSPIISNINHANQLIVAEFIETELAITSLYNNYNWAREASKTVDGEYTREEIVESDIRDKIERKIYIDIIQEGMDNKISTTATYTCSAYEGVGSETYLLKETIVEEGDKDIYIFFKPLVLDKIIINKDIGVIEEFDIFLVSQNMSSLYNLDNIEIPDNVPMVYSNLSSCNLKIQPKIQPLIKKETKDRIKNVSIKLYEDGISSPRVEFNTAREE